MKTASARLSACLFLGAASLFVTACGSDTSSNGASPSTGGNAGTGGKADTAGKSGGAGASAGSAGKGGNAGTGGGVGKGGSAGTSGAGNGGTSVGGNGAAAGSSAGTAGSGDGGSSAGGTTSAGSGGANAGNGGSSAGGSTTAGNGGTGTGGTGTGGTGGTGDAGSAGTSAGGSGDAGNAGTSAGGSGDAGNGGASGGAGNGGTSAGGAGTAGNGGSSAGAAGSGGAAAGSGGAGGSTQQRPNKMFVTSKAVDLATFNGRSEGDALCQKLAASAGLPNVDQYRVWLSDKTVDARQALGNARGWVRTDDLPFADTTGDLSNGKIFYPPRLDEKGTDVGENVKVVTGTKDDGTKAPNELCDGWAGTGNVRIGDPNRTTEAWTSSNSDGCTGAARLYCFETSFDVPVSPPPLPKTAKVIFVLRESFKPGPNGRTAADDACAKEAKSASLPGDYVALLPLGKEGALDRVSANNLPWLRPDGVVVAKAKLDQPRLVAPPNVTANGQGYIGSSRPIVTGIVGNFTAEPALQCVDWTKTEGDPSAGVATVTARANETDGNWHTAATDICGHDKAGVYCVSKK